MARRKLSKLDEFAWYAKRYGVTYGQLQTMETLGTLEKYKSEREKEFRAKERSK